MAKGRHRQLLLLLSTKGGFIHLGTLVVPPFSNKLGRRRRERTERVSTHSAHATSPFAGALEPEKARVIEFKLLGNHSEDTVDDTLEAVGYNMTVFEPLGNRMFAVTAVSTLVDDN